jgi:hypothetical protein
MKRIVKWFLPGVMILVFSLSKTDQINAQCPMCRLSAETNLKDGGTQGKGLNAGILFMLSLPYLMVGSLGYVWWKNNQKVRGREDI